MTEPVFIFKVALAGRKSIWRRIALEGNHTLDDLHWMIFSAFDRDDEHLYSFYFPRPGTKKLSMSRMRDAIEYACPFSCGTGGPVDGGAERSAAEAKLQALKLQPKQVFFYLFDFGDEWWHQITVEAVDAPAEKGKYPRILDSRGQSPPQYPDLDEEDDGED